jgi:hypothetical protein
MGVLDVFNWEGLSVAPGSTLKTVLPSWTRLDNAGGGLRLSSVEIRRGRQDEFEQTETGTMTATFNDRNSDLDPTSVDYISRPLAFAVRNPVTDTWHPRFRGAVDDHEYELDPSGLVKGTVTLEAVDALDYFSNFHLHPNPNGVGPPGDPPPARSTGFVFYEDTLVTGPQIRINQALADCEFPSGLTSIFTGNVNVLEAKYSPGESILSVMRDAADAEFPGIGNLFVDKYGVVCFHGRNARFDPTGTAATATHWDFHSWTAGTGGIQIRPPFSVASSRRPLRNQAMAYPSDMRAKDRLTQVVEDLASIAAHGGRSWEATDLMTKDGIVTGNTGPEECLAFAQYIINNYASPAPRVSQLSFKALWPSDIRGPDLWEFVTQVDVSDQIVLTREFPGGGGIAAETYFVEGISETWRYGVKDLDTGFPFLDMTLDLSPATYWQEPIT